MAASRYTEKRIHFSDTKGEQTMNPMTAAQLIETLSSYIRIKGKDLPIRVYGEGEYKPVLRCWVLSPENEGPRAIIEYE